MRDAKSLKQPKSSIARQRIKRVIELKAQGFSESQVLEMMHERGEISRRVFYRLKEKTDKEIIDDAKALCLATVARLQDSRQRLMRIFSDLYNGKTEDGKRDHVRAMMALRQVVEIDKELPKVCQMLGLVDVPEQKIRITINDPELEQKPVEELRQTYESYKLQCWN